MLVKEALGVKREQLKHSKSLAGACFMKESESSTGKYEGSVTGIEIHAAKSCDQIYIQ